jgi:membrane-bound lytic murein transglycosylase F
VLYLKFISFIIVSVSLLIACSDAKPHLEEIKERGELRVLSRYSPTTYYVKGNDIAGLEYELAQRFAEHLNVGLSIIVPNNIGEMLTLIRQDQADIAAAGLTITPERRQKVRFGPVYQEVTEQLVYRSGNRRPKDITDLREGEIEVVANSSHAEQLRTLKEEIPDLSWVENEKLESSGLLELVQLEMIDYTIADSNEVAANQSLFPELRVAFDLAEPEQLAWAMPLSDDLSLYNEMALFFEELQESGDLERLLNKYYGYIHRFDYVDTRMLHRRILTTLPLFQSLFQDIAQQYHFDWKLLAAISYQESHWDPDAVSSTGVKGMMMLTRGTARQMGVDDRTDPVESVSAGAAYLDYLRNRLPDRIQEPDKTWLALAAYNVGFGHLEDARILTEQNNQNPDIWSDVKKHLPLLAKKKWYEHTRYGYARGGEPVRYIENIRRYYNILIHSQQRYLEAPPNLMLLSPPAAL